MRLPLLLASAAMALAACTAHDSSTTADGSAGAGGGNTSVAAASGSLSPDHRTRLANLPDRGALFAYTAATPITRSAYTFHEVTVSEDHALRAIVTGTLDFEAPDGTPIKLKYDHHVEHADGNWTWIGRPAGAKPGTEAIITFGDKAVFGTIPNGRKLPLRLTVAQGHTYLMETDAAKLATLRSVGNKPTGPDVVPVPAALASARDKVQALAAARPQQLTAAGDVPESATVDVVIGYTNGFATRLGGTSQALTRLNFIVDVTNQAFNNSQIVGRVRLVNTVAVNYPDATNNQTALRELTGVTCTEEPNGDLKCSEAPVPAALQPLVNARATYHADLMSLVRNFNDPENESCGIAWLVGGKQEPITAGDAYAGVSVVSDSNGMVAPPAFPDNGYVCRDETFAHEIAHNMGSAHDVTTAMGGDGVLQANEYGRYPYSFGYRTDAVGFFTIMAYGDSALTSYRMYSNPRIATCKDVACGTANADNAQSLSNTIPVVASFYTSLAVTTRVPNDIDGDGKSDLLLRLPTQSIPNNLSWWLMNGSTRTATGFATMGASYRIAATGDFNGDGKLDIVWTSDSRDVRIGFGNGTGFGATPTTPGTFPVIVGTYAAGWTIAGAGDIDGDGKSDILLRNNAISTDNFSYWVMNGATRTRIAMLTLAASYSIAGTGDFNDDGKLDIVWTSAARDVRLWFGDGNGFGGTTPGSFPVIVGTYASGWIVGGVGDVDGDGKSDIVMRYPAASVPDNLAYWVMNGATRTRIGTATMAASYTIASFGDYNADGLLDIAWTSASRDLRVWFGNGTAFGGTVATPGSFPAIVGTYASGWTVVK